VLYSEAVRLKRKPKNPPIKYFKEKRKFVKGTAFVFFFVLRACNIIHFASGASFFSAFYFLSFFFLVWLPTDYARCYRRHESIKQLFGELLLRRHVSLRRIKQLRVLLERVLILFFFCPLDYRVRSQTNIIYFYRERSFNKPYDSCHFLL